MPLLQIHRSPEEIATAFAGIDALLQAMYQGRSVRTPTEFKEDLAALHIAQEVLEQLTKEARRADAS